MRDAVGGSYRAVNNTFWLFCYATIYMVVVRKTTETVPSFFLDNLHLAAILLK